MKTSIGTNTSTKGLLLFLCATPLLFVTLEDWSSGILLIGFLLCSVHRLLPHPPFLRLQPTAEKQRLRVMGVFLIPSLLITIMASVRKDLDASLLDSMFRFVVAIPIFLFVLRNRLGVSKWLYRASALSLVLTFLNIVLFPQPERWGVGRLATAFSDPLVLGYSSLMLGAAAVASVFFTPNPSRLWIAGKIGIGLLGATISVMTGSRSGWLALPLLVLIFATSHRERSKNWLQLGAGLGALALALGLLWAYSSSVHTRVNEAVSGILSYPLHGIAPDTSIGLRMTFLRIAWAMLSQSPLDALTGFGDTFSHPPFVPNAVREFASPFAIYLAFASGFHNEVVTTAVASGILTGLAVGGLFVYPASVFIYYLRSLDAETRASAHLGLIVVACFGISSLSTEVFGLKHTVSFYALMLALLLGSCIGRNTTTTTMKKL